LRGKKVQGISTALLGAIHGGVRLFQYISRHLAAKGVQGDADAGTVASDTQVAKCSSGSGSRSNQAQGERRWATTDMLTSCQGAESA
jgi:hypothetical protein